MAFIKFFFFVLLIAFAVAQNLPAFPVTLPSFIPIPGAGGETTAAPAVEAATEGSF